MKALHKYQPGDILLCYANNDDASKRTSQHVAIVVRESDATNATKVSAKWKQQPATLAHMSLDDHKLIIENTVINETKRRHNHGRGKLLVRIPAWNQRFIDKLCDNLINAESCNKFKINNQTIETQKAEYKQGHYLANANILNRSSVKKYFSPTPNSTQDITCHELIISIIQYTCDQMKIETPWLVKIDPQAAWANVLKKRAERVAFLQTWLQRYLPPNSYHLNTSKLIETYKDPSTRIRITMRKPLTTSQKNNVTMNSFFNSQKKRFAKRKAFTKLKSFATKEAPNEHAKLVLKTNRRYFCCLPLCNPITQNNNEILKTSRSKRNATKNPTSNILQL